MLVDILLIHKVTKVEEKNKDCLHSAKSNLKRYISNTQIFYILINEALRCFHTGCVFCDAAQIRCAFFDALRAHRVFSRDASLSDKVRKFQL